MLRRRFALTLDGRLATAREVLVALLVGRPCMVGAFLLSGPVEAVKRNYHEPVDARDLN